MITVMDFVGLWSLEREIEDALAGAPARLNGTCRFVARATTQAELIQEEKGLLQMPGLTRPMEAERCYIWRAQGAGIAVFFDDERFFHSFDPMAPAPSADHDCAPDRYHVRYEFAQWPESWTAEWRVNGPRKDYVSVTRYTRLQE